MAYFWSELVKKPLKIGGKETQSFGHLNAVFMNPEGGELIAYMAGMGKVLSPVDIEQITSEAVLIRGLDVFVSPLELVRLQDYGFKRCLLNFKKVKSRAGKSFGKVRDFQLDKPSMRVDKIIVAKGLWGFTWDERIFSWHNIYEVTDSAIILKHEPESTKYIKIKKAAMSPS